MIAFLGVTRGGSVTVWRGEGGSVFPGGRDRERERAFAYRKGREEKRTETEQNARAKFSLLFLLLPLPLGKVFRLLLSSPWSSPSRAARKGGNHSAQSRQARQVVSPFCGCFPCPVFYFCRWLRRRRRPAAALVPPTQAASKSGRPGQAMNDSFTYEGTNGFYCSQEPTKYSCQGKKPCWFFVVFFFAFRLLY